MVTLLPLLEVWHHQPICNVVSALPHLHPIQSPFFPSLLSLKAFSIELFVRRRHHWSVDLACFFALSNNHYRRRCEEELVSFCQGPGAREGGELPPA